MVGFAWQCFVGCKPWGAGVVWGLPTLVLPHLEDRFREAPWPARRAGNQTKFDLGEGRLEGRLSDLWECVAPV